METLLDKLRRHELQLHHGNGGRAAGLGDALRALLAQHQGADVGAVDSSGWLFNIRA